MAAARGSAVFGTELELSADGFVTMKVALPDSGSNAATALAHMVAEMLGFTSRDKIRLIWGDTDIAPSERRVDSEDEPAPCRRRGLCATPRTNFEKTYSSAPLLY